MLVTISTKSEFGQIPFFFRENDIDRNLNFQIFFACLTNIEIKIAYRLSKAGF